ncbi:MAG: hypothetical protein HY553_14645 [Elusimicrobia bacterium]|nr:hypothetical protein [Elusimicrobiota bacterium]
MTGRGWRLKSVALRSFRGVGGETTLSFDARPALLRGANGQGKSTFALGLQWVLFGKFPGGVLANSGFARFLNPATGTREPSGTVVLAREGEELIFTRGEAGFSLKAGAETHRAEEAEAKRDELLGLDMDTFCRAVLLQQSRVRGLLLDEVAERNKALERLLGMEALGEILEVCKPKPFHDAAKEWLEKIESDKRAHEGKETVLRHQRDQALARAREHQFQNKDFNLTGLQDAYAQLELQLAAAAKKYQVSLTALPRCTNVKAARELNAKVREALKVIRLGSNLAKQLAPIEAGLADLIAKSEGWKGALAEREQAKQLVEKRIAATGDEAALTERRVKLEKEKESLAAELKAADALGTLLRDAAEYVEASKPKDCPICEQPFPAGKVMGAALGARAEALASDLVKTKREALEAVARSLEAVASAQEELKGLRTALAGAQKMLGDLAKAIGKRLGDENLSEAYVGPKLKAQSEELHRQREELRKGIEAMEDDLGEIERRLTGLADGLLPVIEKRDELDALAKEWEAKRKEHEKDKSQSDAMLRMAARIEQIRQALLGAKEEIAAETLGKAGPRAQELYGTLVRHPIFDTLSIRTKPVKNKVDYVFEVSSGKRPGSEREARLVLSDGQMTGAALALFYSLADCADHGLGFLYVDDPTQNLDYDSKQAMAKVIASISRERQLIVSSQDEDFVNSLKSEGFAGSVVTLKDWSGSPKVEVE